MTGFIYMAFRKVARVSAVGGIGRFSFRFRKVLASMDVYKSNQFDGSWSALFASFAFKGKSLIRSGYSVVLFEQNYMKRLLYQWLEIVVYKFAHLVFVSTEWERQKIKLFNGNVHVLPNFVESQDSVKELHLRNTQSLLYVGRVNDIQKNFSELVKAISNSGYSLHLIGGYSNDEKMMIQKVCKKHDCDYKMLGKVENTRVSEYYQEYAFTLWRVILRVCQDFNRGDDEWLHSHWHPCSRHK